MKAPSKPGPGSERAARKARRGASPGTPAQPDIAPNGAPASAPDSPPDASRPITVVAIGASAGGLEPIGQFFDAMPHSSGLAFVVIQHLAPEARSLLSELLGKHTSMQVRPATHGTIVEADHVYVIPPGSYLSIGDGRLHLAPAREGSGARMPLDVFLKSLADTQGKFGVGIVLSGTGADGAQGMKALKARGGLTLVQDPAEAQYDGMPRQAMEVAEPDRVLSVRNMPETVLQFVALGHLKQPDHGAGATPPLDAQGQRWLTTIVGLLHASTGQNFERYKHGTLHRRIQRRMGLLDIKTFPAYIAALRESPAELEALAKDLLIHVTQFFRDPKAFAFLGDKLLPDLLREHLDGEPVRVWVAGCSTGEEAYSLGMLLLEQIAAVRPRLKLQIFASDIDDEALEVARAGVYPESIQDNVSPERLQRFFIRVNSHFKVDVDLRQCVIFSRHDVLTDPPFSRLDLMSCRNLFIYLKPDAQYRVLALFHFALNPGGILFLGSAEAPGTATDLFEPIDRDYRIYRHIGRGCSAETAARILAPRAVALTSARMIPTAQHQPTLPELVEQKILDTYAPAAVVTNRQLAPLYYFGRIDPYLQVAAGEPNQDLLSMAREGLRPALHETIDRAFRSKRRVSVKGIRFVRANKTVTLTIEAQRITNEREDLLLVSFLEDALPARGAALRRAGNAAEASVLGQVQQELSDTRRELTRTIRDLRQANEQMTASNEEVMSMNEEFLSTNEELETSKEELQSLNEELTTVNAQLRQSLDQQQQASTDLTNLLNSSGVATIFLDDKLCIKIFNARMQALFAVIDSDVGRPLADLLPKFADPELLADATSVYSTGISREKEIRAVGGLWYLRVVQPYRIASGHVLGAVITFADVTRLKEAELEAAAARTYAETIVNTVREPLLVLDSELRIVSCNTAFQTDFDVMDSQIMGTPMHDLAHPIFADRQLREAVVRVLSKPLALQTHTLELEPRNGAGRVWRTGIKKFQAPGAVGPMLLLALEDVTHQRHIIWEQLQLIMDTLPEAVIIVDQAYRIRAVNRLVQPMFGYTPDELLGQRVELLVPEASRAAHAEEHARYIADPSVRMMAPDRNIVGLTKGGKEIPLEIGLSPLRTVDEPLVLAAIHDLRQQKRIEDQLREAKAEAERANLAKSRFLLAASHDLRQPLQTIGLLHGILRRRIPDTDTRTTLVKLDDTVGRMTELLDTLVDIDQIESDQIRPEISEFPVEGLLTKLIDEFAPIAAAKGLKLHRVPCSAVIRSDRRLLARMIANLLSNAIKYTDKGRLLLGCRRRDGKLRIEVWDTGIGIPAESIQSVFDEFYRLDRNDSARFGLGLGLYIVRRYASLLGHGVDVSSRAGRGTMFAVVVDAVDFDGGSADVQETPAGTGNSVPSILLIEDDPAQLDAMSALLELEGYHVNLARRGDEALARVRGPDGIRPDVVIADYNLPGGMNGVQVIQQLRTELGAHLPALIVSGDKSDAARRVFEDSGQVLITKPVKSTLLLAALASAVQLVKAGWSGAVDKDLALASPRSDVPQAEIAVIDDDLGIRDAFRLVLEADGHSVAGYGSCEAYLADPNHRLFKCLLVDIALPGMDGPALQQRLKAERVDLPIIFVTGSHDLATAVQTMRDGAADFLQKPVGTAELLASVTLALQGGQQTTQSRVLDESVASRLATLTSRERQVMELMIAGVPSKNIAADLGISQRTAEHHRQNVMRKMAAKSLATLVRMVAFHVPRE